MFSVFLPNTTQISKIQGAKQTNSPPPKADIKRQQSEAGHNQFGAFTRHQPINNRIVTVSLIDGKTTLPISPSIDEEQVRTCLSSLVKTSYNNEKGCYINDF